MWWHSTREGEGDYIFTERIRKSHSQLLCNPRKHRISLSRIQPNRDGTGNSLLIKHFKGRESNTFSRIIWYDSTISIWLICVGFSTMQLLRSENVSMWRNYFRGIRSIGCLIYIIADPLNGICHMRDFGCETNRVLLPLFLSLWGNDDKWRERNWEGVEVVAPSKRNHLRNSRSTIYW